MKEELRCALSSEELEKRRAKALFYARLRRLIFLGCLLLASGLLVYFYFMRFSETGFSEQKAPAPELGSVLGPDGERLSFDYSRMIKLMREYAYLVIDKEAGMPWGDKPIDQLRDLLQRLRREHEVYCDHLELIRKSKHYVPTRRRQKATQHYQRSIENAISNLQRILQDYGPLPAPPE